MRRAFVVESNRIEGITRPPTTPEIWAHDTLWALDRVTVADLEVFVTAVAGSRAVLRRNRGMDVTVGGHRPIEGGPDVEGRLRWLLRTCFSADGALAASPYQAHREYETLHPFMDGNGRSGRALWAWQMMRDGQDPFALPFLHLWYYQSLGGGR